MNVTSDNGGATNVTYTTKCPDAYTCTDTATCTANFTAPYDITVAYACGNLVLTSNTGNYTSKMTCQQSKASLTAVVKNTNYTLSFVSKEDGKACNTNTDCTNSSFPVCSREIQGVTTTTAKGAANICVDSTVCGATENLAGTVNNYYCSKAMAYCADNTGCTSSDNSQCCARYNATYTSADNKTTGWMTN